MSETVSATRESSDALQARLARYARDLHYDALPADTVAAARARVVDTLAAAVGGFHDAPCRIARALGADMLTNKGATIIGTRLRVPPDVAAFANGAAARSGEMNDVYHRPGSRNGHPSDVIPPLLAVAEHGGASGRDFLAAVVLAYEVYLRFADTARNKSFDAANFCCLGVALGAGRLLGLTERQLAECLSIAAIPNNALNQTRTGHLTMWKSTAAGQAGRAGVFAALLAAKGMEGPRLPFEGKHGWSAHVAREPIAFEVLGGEGVSYKLNETFIKPRSACLHTLAPILAAEKVANGLRGRVGEVERVTIEVYQAKERALGSADNTAGTGAHHWNPETRESADHSIPYCVAATLIEGTVTPASFGDERLHDPQLRGLLQKVQQRDDAAFTHAYERIPVQYRARVTAILRSGERLVGETGGEHGDLADPMSEADISGKFRQIVEPALGADAVTRILGELWTLEQAADVSHVPAMFDGLDRKP